jgi:Ca2+/H+ antiporter
MPRWSWYAVAALAVIGCAVALGDAVATRSEVATVAISFPILVIAALAGVVGSPLFPPVRTMEVVVVGAVVFVRLAEVGIDRAPAAKGDSSADIMGWYRKSQKGHGAKVGNGGQATS